MQYLAKTLAADFAFVGEMSPEHDNMIRTVAVYADDKVCEICIGDHCGKLKLGGGGCSASPGPTAANGFWLIALSAIVLALRARRRVRA